MSSRSKKSLDGPSSSDSKASKGQSPAIPTPASLDGKLWQRRLTALVLVLIALPVLYVLSIGPAYRAEVRHGLPEETYNAIYSPILSLSERYDAIDDFVKWYVELWV